MAGRSGVEQYMKVLVLTGPESSGKSWLAAELQQHFGGVPRICTLVHRTKNLSRDLPGFDIPEIARGQLKWEDEARARQPFADSRHSLAEQHPLEPDLFGACPTWIEQALLARHYDLHLLLSPETVAWHDDGQRCQPQLTERQAFFQARPMA